MSESHSMHLKAMRIKARQNNKTVPDLAVLEDLASKLISNGMSCPCCNKKMAWRRRDGLVVSLQHDRDGGFRLICIICNLKHHFAPGYLFYDIPQGFKFCNGCKQIKKSERFSKRLYAYCRGCRKARKADWLKKNRERASEYERVRRQRLRDIKKGKVEKCA